VDTAAPSGTPHDAPPDMPPERPGSSHRLDRAAAWVGWFGPARLITSAIAVIAVCAGLFWLLRTSPPPTEASLPTATAVPTSTDPASPGAAPAVTVADSPVSVHVAGAVERPGVYELEPGARVFMALDAAGGVTAEADANALNLAAVVVDGSRVYVPIVGETLPPDSAAGASQGVVVPSGPGALVDVNRATADELDVLPGVGPATATAIVTERERNGPFLSVDDLERVPGIGPAKLDALRELVTT
jgi:competence protein ComEA